MGAETLILSSEIISIHALREESDCGFLFLLTIKAISIHALREESDCKWLCTKTTSKNF